MLRKLWARESVGFHAEYTLLSEGVPVNITGWTFRQTLVRVRGDAGIVLAPAADANGEGFFVTDGAAGKYQHRILPASLQAIADSTGEFTLFGDIVATLPDGSRAFIEDQELTVTEGPTP